jgi:outer membrane protein OmpA-like peptidoglycan-associated protein
MQLDADVLFEPNSSNLTASAKDTLDNAARVLIDYPKTAIVVQGHSDDTGNQALNVELSQRRADSVRAHLIGRGIEPDRVHAVGYGASYAEANVNNRRVDILVKAKAA